MAAISFCVCKPCLLILQTTIMAVEYDGGVIIGADSRTTTGYDWYYFYHCCELLPVVQRG